MLKKGFFALLLAVAPLVVTAADSQYGGTLVTATLADPATLNTAYQYVVKGRIASVNIFSKIVDYSAITSQVIPDLAESWEVSPDGLVYVFHLVKNAKWHDGIPFTAQDVKYTFDAMMEKKGPGYSRLQAFLKSTEVVDDYKVRMTLKQPHAAFLYVLADTYGATTIILPKHIYEGKDWAKVPQNDAPIGTGPFKFKEWIHGERIVLERNPEYYKKGLPYLERVIIRIIPNQPTLEASLQANEVQYTGDASLPGPSVERFKKGADFRVFFYPGTLWHVGFNTRIPPFNNLSVRQAFAYAIDRDDVAKKARYGLVVTCNGMYTEMVPWAFNPKTRLPNYDPAMAAKLLDAAGYPAGRDGVRMKLNWVASAGIGESIVEVVKEQLKKVGVALDIKLMEFGAYTKTVIEGHDFQITAMGGSQNPEPSDWNIFLQTGGYRNIYGYSNPDVDTWMNQAVQVSDTGKRAEYYFKVQEALLRDLPRFNLFTDAESTVAPKGWHDFGVDPEGDGKLTGYQRFERVWCEARWR
jgi:peptide/nickel transport system substrate-binding protein